MNCSDGFWNVKLVLLGLGRQLKATLLRVLCMVYITGFSLFALHLNLHLSEAGPFFSFHVTHDFASKLVSAFFFCRLVAESTSD